MEENHSSPEGIPELEPLIFDLVAEVGLTKHLGGLKATKELVELCRISEGKYVLDVGCGVGMTPCYIAKRYGCRVVGVDISQRMIDRSSERARREGVEATVEFRVADARDLPFQDALFDAVIVESVNVFMQDRRRAISEYARVTKPGGYVGLNETTWIKAPSAEMVERLSRAHISALTADRWEELLEGRRLRDVVVRTYKLSAFSEAVNRARRYGLAALLGAVYRTLVLSIKHPTARRLLKESGSVPKGLFEHMGYGIYVGRKRKGGEQVLSWRA